MTDSEDVNLDDGNGLEMDIAEIEQSRSNRLDLRTKEMWSQNCLQVYSY